MTAPCAGVPLPGGRPTPSGAMLMSQGARSAAVIGCPYLGASAASAALKTSASAAAKTDVLSIDMAHLALGIDPPARDGVAVLHGERGHIGRTPGWTALGNECLSCRLHVTGLVGCSALQDHRPAVPGPRNTEAGERLAQHRRL